MVAADFPAELELRDASRKPFRCPAWATVGDKTYACKLVDLSEAGAGLTFDNPDEIPESFILHLMNRQQISLPCHMVWRDGRHMGVAFFSRPEPKTEPRKKLEVVA